MPTSTNREMGTASSSCRMVAEDAPGREGRNLDHFCLRVEPFDEATIRQRLQAHGAEPGPVEQRNGAEGEGPSIYVSDPEGNVVELKGPPQG